MSFAMLRTHDSQLAHASSCRHEHMSSFGVAWICQPESESCKGSEKQSTLLWLRLRLAEGVGFFGGKIRPSYLPVLGWSEPGVLEGVFCCGSHKCMVLS